VGKTVNLTGPRLLTVGEITKLYTERTGRRVNFRVVGLNEAILYHRNRMTLPPEQEIFLPNWASWHVAMSKGETNYIDPALEQLLGRKPKDIEDMAEDLFAAKTNDLDTKDFV
jgi:NAD(P)H dehydrogenase (quinone)